MRRLDFVAFIVEDCGLGLLKQNFLGRASPKHQARVKFCDLFSNETVIGPASVIGFAKAAIPNRASIENNVIGVVGINFFDICFVTNAGCAALDVTVAGDKDVGG